jgi:predicted Zn-dependent protease
MSSDTQADPTNKIDRLLDAIELVKADRRETAQPILRDLISEDSDFEDAWLWMSLVVENLDQSIL